MKVAVPDLVSPSYFPLIAAVELGFFAAEGLETELELVFPVTDAAEALREGRVDVLAGSAHAALHAFPNWRGVRMPMALSRYMYWFLVMRSDLGIAKGDLDALRDVSIGAAPGPDDGLRVMLADAGLDLDERSIRIQPVTGVGDSVSFGVTAAAALEAGSVDGFWANGMGAEVATRRGVGGIVVDARRGDGPPGATDFTFSALFVRQSMFDQEPEVAAAVVRAVERAQATLRDDPARATEVGQRLYPEMEASLIATLIERDTPYYEAEIDDAALAGVEAFAARIGLDASDARDPR